MANQKTENKPKLVISVSGGGALGIGPLQFMRRLEKNLKAHLGEISVAFAGTSTGSIIAGALCRGMDAETIYSLYREKLPSIFKKKKNMGVLSKDYVKYENVGLKESLYEIFGTAKMNEFPKPIFIPTTFMNGDSVEKVWDRNDSWMDQAFAIMSSCSAPTYFDPLQIKQGKKTCYYCDGGMWANDPIMTLEAGLKKMGQADNIKILSFNTGMLAPNNKPSNFTAIGWLSYVMDNWIARTGNANLFEARANLGKENVFRCEPKVDKSYPMDDLKKLDIVSNLWDEYYDAVKKDVLKFVRSTL